MDAVEGKSDKAPLLAAAKIAFMAMLALLPWMKGGVAVGYLTAYPADLMFVVAASLWLAALAARQERLRLDRSFILIAAYFAAMAISAVFSVNPKASVLKLATQIYLLLLPVLAFNLIRTPEDLRRAFLWWLIPAFAVAAYGIATLALFPFVGWNSFLQEPLHHFGTLPPGPYPRIELTFEFPSMLANYLGVSLMLLLLAGVCGWFGRRTVMAASAALLVTAFFALTPGFGGILAMLSCWVWYRNKGRSVWVARCALAAAVVFIIGEVLVSSLTPIVGPTAPFVIHVPGFSAPWAPAIRLLAWLDAAHVWAASPLVGHGIGVDAVQVLWQAPESSEPSYVTDAHNFILSIGAQCGILGVAALIAIAWSVARAAARAAYAGRDDPLLFGLAIAWLGSFVIQGLVGAFEDTRHLWILLGFIAAVTRLRASGQERSSLRI